MIIGLCGLKNSGKDTVGAYLIKNHGYQRRYFAEPLKRSVAALLDVPLGEIEKLKNDPQIKIYVGNDEIFTLGTEPFATEPVKIFTFREFLQRYGTESHRDIFGEDFWVDQCLPIDAWYSGRKIVVTDCRFENEAKRIHELGGVLVYVIREFLINQDPHRSENPELLPYDYVLNNSGTLEDLYDEVEHLLGAINA